MRSYVLVAYLILLSIAGCSSTGKTGRPPVVAHDVRAIAVSSPAALSAHSPISVTQAKRLVEIESRMAQASRVRVDGFYILELSEFNASIQLKDKKVFLMINRPLLSKLEGDDAALAALIGHEMAHIVLGHAASRQNVDRLIGGGGAALGFIAGFVIPGAGTLVNAGSQAITKAYSRDQENEADRLGLELATKAGFSPSGMLRLFAVMPTRGTGTSGFFDSHPGKTERMTTVKNLIQEKYSDKESPSKDVAGSINP